MLFSLMVKPFSYGQVRLNDWPDSAGVWRAECRYGFAVNRQPVIPASDGWWFVSHQNGTDKPIDWFRPVSPSAGASVPRGLSPYPRWYRGGTWLKPYPDRSNAVQEASKTSWCHRCALATRMYAFSPSRITNLYFMRKIRIPRDVVGQGPIKKIGQNA